MMILEIDTSKKKFIKVAIKKNGRFLVKKEKETRNNQSELLLILIRDILQKKNIDLNEIDEIQVENRGDSFTSLRTGIITANALAYILGVSIKDFKNNNKKNKEKINIVVPKYNREPNITMAKAKK